jgi:hypothetical protein
MFIHHYPLPRAGCERIRYMATFHKPRHQSLGPTEQELQRWCYETYGPPGFRVNTHDMRWKDAIKYGEIEFEREADLMLFLLKWQS